MQAPFSTISGFRDLLAAAPGPNEDARKGAQDRNGQLTKPPGALGRLEDLAIWYAAWRGDARPEITAPQVIIFAGNHGVCAQGVSAFPPEVTAQMVANFEHGGAAINQLSKAFGAKMDVYPLALDTPTADFTTAPAMTESEFIAALQTGWTAVDPQADLVVTGEMGIGNTTSAAAVAAASLCDWWSMQSCPARDQLRGSRLSAARGRGAVAIARSRCPQTDGGTTRCCIRHSQS
jgi:nicotinate-nucleotide--dimethylbenzimidazole phosphoribosyltransferase